MYGLLVKVATNTRAIYLIQMLIIIWTHHVIITHTRSIRAVSRDHLFFVLLYARRAEKKNALAQFDHTP